MTQTPENQQQYGSILTILGENAEQNGKLQNKQITFTHMAIGDANDEYVQPDRKQTVLVNELARIPVNSVDVLQPTPDSVPMLKVEAILPDDVNDLVIREFAAVATFDGNTYFHAVGNNARIYVPPPVNNGNVSTPVTLEMIFVITSADPIVEIDPNVVTASRSWVSDEVKKYSESDTQTKQLFGTKNSIVGSDIDGYSAIKLQENNKYYLWYAWDEPSGEIISFVENNDYGTALLTTRQQDGSEAYYEFVNQRVRNLRLMGYVEGWGADEAALDTYEAHQKAAAYCKATGLTLNSNIGLIYKTSQTVDFRDLKSVDYKAQLLGTGNFITMLLGGDSTIEQQYYNQSVHKVNRGGPLPAIRIVGSKKSTIRIGEASYVQVWADSSESLNGTQDETSISKIHIQQVRTLELNTNINPDGENPTNKAWINSNDFYLQVCDILIVDGIYHHNSNKFHGGNFEAADSKIHFKKGQSNQVKDVRGENDLIVEFDSDTSNNAVITNWTSYPNGFNTAKQVIDNGINNVVKNVNDLFNMRLVLMAFSSASFKKDSNNNPNLLGLANLDVNGQLMSRPAYALIYKTPMLEISPGGEFFRFYVDDRTAGGVTVKIWGYDANGALINGTDGDVHFPSSDNPNARFGQVNNHINVGSSGQNLFYVTNRNAKYIEIECAASASGVTFKRFCLVSTTSNKSGDEYISASAMIPNIS